MSSGPLAGPGQELYQCAVRISSVSNVTNHTQKLTDGVARLAAAAIGLRGFGPRGNGLGPQFQTYPYKYAIPPSHSMRQA